MLSNRLAFTALAIACIGAAAGGGYLASRRNATPVEAAASTPPVPATSSTSTVVRERGGSVSDSIPSLVPPAASTSTPPAPAERRPEPTTRAATRAEAPAAKSATASAKSAETPPAIERTSSSSTASNPSSTQSTPTPSAATNTPTVDPITQAQQPDDREAQESLRPEPPKKVFEELVIAADSVIGLQADTAVTSERARVEDRVEARVTRDVRIRDVVAIPAGTRAIGSVTQVERGGKFKERARLGIRFHTLMQADGSRLPISTETIYREGDAPGNETAKKVGGGAIAGTILGAIIGGGKGAAIGATAGAAAGAGTVAAGDRSAATLRPGEPVTVRILSPVVVTLEK